MPDIGKILALAIVIFAPMSAGAQTVHETGKGRIIIPEGAEGIYEKWHYAPAVKVGDTIYASGVIGRPGDGENAVEQQFVSAFEGLAKVLGAAGASLDDIVEMTTFHVNMRETVDTFIEVKDRFITKDFPAWTAIGVETLFSPHALVEIRVVAVKKN